MITHHSSDDKDDDEGEGGEEDDEDDVVGREQGGGGEQVRVHLPYLVGQNMCYMSFHPKHTLLCCKKNLWEWYV